MRKLVRAAFPLVLVPAFVLIAVITGNASTSSRPDKLGVESGEKLVRPEVVAERHATLQVKTTGPTMSNRVSTRSLEVRDLPAKVRHLTRKALKRGVRAQDEGFLLAGSCFGDCLRNNIPDEVLIACIVVCGGGYAPGCAACLGYYAGVAAYCAYQCS